MNRPLLFLLLVLIAQPLSGSGATVIIPQSASAKFGDTYADPFFFAELPSVVQVYGSREFSGLSSDIIQITGMSFRLDPGDGASLSVVIPQLTIFIASYSGSLSTITRFGLADLQYTVAVDRSVQLKAKPTTPDNFSIALPLDRPFVYDRRAGNLVIDFRASGTITGFGQSIDAQGSNDSVLVRNQPDGRTVLDKISIVTQFSYTAVPEPSPLRVLGIGLTIAALGGFRRKG